jgi:hypothetical protein
MLRSIIIIFLLLLIIIMLMILLKRTYRVAAGAEHAQASGNCRDNDSGAAPCSS